MCGIAGLIGFSGNEVSKSSLRKMIKSISHRGPDGVGEYFSSNIALGHVRLSILDLTKNGQQPFYSEHENIILVFNGEIYNFKKLKKELHKDYNFLTQTDSEVIIAAYLKYGEDCLSHFNGMFSFALYDKEKNILFAARDRFGIKPFYYYLDKNHFVFGSEIKSILCNEMIVTPDLNEGMLFDFIAFNRTDHTKETCFKNIYNLRPGSKLSLNLINGEAKFDEWYDFSNIKEENSSFKDSKESLLKSLKNSVRLHLVSDVEIGSALSGGLDSSIIATLIKEEENKKLQSFSAVYDKNWVKDESVYVDSLCNEKNIIKNLVRPNVRGLLENIDEIIYQQEEPFISASIYASWCVYKEASKKEIKVLLNGQGADEIFSYDYMAAFYFKELIKSLKLFKLTKEILLFSKKQIDFFLQLNYFCFYVLQKN